MSHTLRSLTRSLKHDFTRGTDFVWGSLYGLTSFAGLQVFLQSWCGASTFVISRGGQTLDDRIKSLTAGGCNALSATPTMWRRLLMSHPAELAALRLKQVTLGGEIADQLVLDALCTAFPDARITHIYASTEAGVGFAVNDGMAGFPATYLDSLPAGIRISVDDRQHLLVLQCGDQSSYLATDVRLHGESGFIDTGDLVERKGDRYEFLGRADGMINVGGDKVCPEEVEKFLLGCDGVKLARVTGRKSSLTGSLVEAEIVPDTSHARDVARFRAALLAQCQAGLAQHKVPAILNVVDSIELTALGKVKR